ncbi:MAG TPA: L-aspartate oxidase [Aquihabitans sp.]|jgi:L-aspartate oxidase|nr:L-aspartate oxidase [Aquihabitans sp.]
MSDAELDLLVLGSGVAGLSAAVRAADTHKMRVGVLTKGELPQATTRWAQGGVAAALGGDPDSTDLHLADTLAAGAGLCDAEAVRVLVDEGPARVSDLIMLGAIFDRDARGELELAREGGHTLARIVHAGGSATGAEVERALVEAVQLTMAVIHEHAFALDLIVEAGRCRGVTARFADGSVREVRAANVLVTTGGAGQLYAVTTNPLEATGDGIAMALRAGVAVADVEFVQFHPTALSVDSMPRPLLTEALRGHGALLRDTEGERFVDEMQPRDVVSRAETWRMQQLGTDHVFLDATGLEQFDQRFPNIVAELRAAGLDPATDWLPVAPAAHYTCGGIVTDLHGASSLAGLWAAGEVACSGVHGANRLASNSLLEGMVFGPRAVEGIEAGVSGPEASGAMRGVLGMDPDRPDAVPPGVIGGRFVHLDPIEADPGLLADDPAKARTVLQRTLTDNAGVLRDAGRLDVAAAAVATALRTPRGTSVADHELHNLATVGRAAVDAARRREESRGAHTRDDFPEISPAWSHRIVYV